MYKVKTVDALPAPAFRVLTPVFSTYHGVPGFSTVLLRQNRLTCAAAQPCRGCPGRL